MVVIIRCDRGDQGGEKGCDVCRHHPCCTCLRRQRQLIHRDRDSLIIGKTYGGSAESDFITIVPMR